MQPNNNKCDIIKKLMKEMEHFLLGKKNARRQPVGYKCHICLREFASRDTAEDKVAIKDPGIF